MLVAAFEAMSCPWIPPAPADVLPLVWGVATAVHFPDTATGLLADAFRRTRQAGESIRGRMAAVISHWLQRAQLTRAESDLVGLHRRIDWEGELIPVAAELLRLAKDAGVLHTFYFFVDQLEDLFRPTFSELRRARILTDLRGLVDEIDEGTPVGLLMTWSPELTAAASYSGHRDEVERLFQSRYEALYTRMQRRRVSLPLLELQHAVPFAAEWVDALRNEEGFDRERQPALDSIVTSAWQQLERARRLFPGGRVTPRELLSALATEVDQRAGVA
jgi:hypothetical protein